MNEELRRVINIDEALTWADSQPPEVKAELVQIRPALFADIWLAASVAALEKIATMMTKEAPYDAIKSLAEIIAPYERQKL